MRLDITLLVSFSIVLATVLYASADSSDDEVEGGELGLIRYKRRVNGAGRRRRPHRAEDEEHPANDEEGARRRRPGRPGRRNRPGRVRRPGRRGHGGRRQRPMGDPTNLSHRAQRLITTLSSSQNSFASNLHREVGRPVADVIYSPCSIHQALTMTYMGARGRTAFQMKRALSLQGLGRRAHRANKGLNTLINNPGNATLKVANAVYAKPGISLEEGFVNGLNQFYSTNITLFDFQHPGGPEAPINEWVSRQTNTLIPTILSPGLITDMTAMVLVNAIYFKANWKAKFSEQMTMERMFSKTESLQVPVQMMELEEKFKTGVLQDFDARVLELPYEGDRFSMLVILPTETTGLTALEERLTPEHLAVNLDTVVPSKVKVYLPRFKLETSTSLKSSLQNMGMVKPFSMDQADFSGIDGSNDLYISDVIHRAVVEVNEEGSEAAGATAVIIGLRSSMMQPSVPEFRCDHPFLFFIRDNVSKVNLFIGKFSGGA